MSATLTKTMSIGKAKEIHMRQRMDTRKDIQSAARDKKTSIRKRITARRATKSLLRPMAGTSGIRTEQTPNGCKSTQNPRRSGCSAQEWSKTHKTNPRRFGCSAQEDPPVEVLLGGSVVPRGSAHIVASFGNFKFGRFGLSAPLNLTRRIMSLAI